VSKLYELTIYTMGDKAYAREIAGLLDPGGRLFGGRVVSAADRCARRRRRRPGARRDLGGRRGLRRAAAAPAAGGCVSRGRLATNTPRATPRPASTKSHEKGLDVLLASEAHVLILDDTDHVWAGHRRNLIQAGDAGL
jgi:hypothetical protein